MSRLSSSQDGWTDERIASLKTLWAAGLSTSQIARELDCGFSRNAIIGKAHRLHLNGRVARQQPRGDAGGGALHSIRARFTRPRPRLRPGPDAAPAVVDEAPVAPSNEVEHKGVSLFDLTADTCRFPIGEGFACGAMPLPKRPYCLHHCTLCYSR